MASIFTYMWNYLYIVIVLYFFAPTRFLDSPLFLTWQIRGLYDKSFYMEGNTLMMKWLWTFYLKRFVSLSLKCFLQDTVNFPYWVSSMIVEGKKGRKYCSIWFARGIHIYKPRGPTCLYVNDISSTLCDFCYPFSFAWFWNHTAPLPFTHTLFICLYVVPTLPLWGGKSEACPS